MNKFSSSLKGKPNKKKSEKSEKYSNKDRFSRNLAVMKEDKQVE